MENLILRKTESNNFGPFKNTVLSTNTCLMVFEDAVLGYCMLKMQLEERPEDIRGSKYEASEASEGIFLFRFNHSFLSFFSLW